MANTTIIDGNGAAADAAYRLNDICSIYPITPSSPMAESADEWQARKRPNVWGSVPSVIEMQSEAGAAGAMHGALQGGALTTSFTASQGLLLMIPNMYKIAGELTSTVLHVAARSLATQGLSIFGDHQDVMAVRQTGYAMLASVSVQECHDQAAIAQAVTLRSRVPFLHFFDGFRTSHELNTCELLTDAQLRELVPDELVRAHRGRALSPEHPYIRGTAQNPDTYFQSRETANQFYDAVPGILSEVYDQFAKLTGRRYDLVDYYGDPEADRIVVIMGSGLETVHQTIDYLRDKGEKVGAINIRLYRPFPTQALLAAIPASVKAIAVLDRTKEPGAGGEPLFLDVAAAMGEAVARGQRETMPVIIGGRYGLSSKEFTPGMAAAVYAELAKADPKPRFTVGINDDVTHLSLEFDSELDAEDPQAHRAIFYGLGSDGTVGANKNTIKIMGHQPNTFAQGYFVYDSKKSGGRTISHLRFGPKPIHAPYLVRSAGFIGVHHWVDLEKIDVLEFSRPGTVLLINSPYPVEEIWDRFPRPMQEKIIERGIKVYVVDAGQVARSAGLGGRTNTVLQTCFFAISGVMERDAAIAAIKDSITKTYGKKSQEIVDKNHAAVDASIEHLHELPIPEQASAAHSYQEPVPASAPQFVREVTAKMMIERGNDLPVSALPDDGSYPSGTTKYEKRNISDIIAVWDPDTCIQCGNCSFVCPHGVLRAKWYKQDERFDNAPAGFKSMPIDAAGLPNRGYTLQVYAEDCTGCGLCVEACPVHPLDNPNRKAINLEPVLDREAERENVKFFETLHVNVRSRVDFGTVRGAQFLEPLFEFSGACSGCGETPYVKLLSQLFGDRASVANATGCSSIYGGNLPTTPWAKNEKGRGPAWSNSLFEDNAEFGLGLRLAADHQTRTARRLLDELRPLIGQELADSILNAPQQFESELAEQASRIEALRAKLEQLDGPEVDELKSLADHLLRRSVWIVGGDGWAYDIGSGGLDHVLASGRNINILVLDTEVYSNTGGQSSKSTPLGAVAKFASGGKTTTKKDLAMQAIAYGNVYVARVAMGADPQQTLKAFREAEAYDGPSLILAYSHCISHGIDMKMGLDQQYRAVNSGHWPLMRYNPVLREQDKNPFLLDSPRPRLPLREYHGRELRFKMLQRANPAEAERLLELGQEQVTRRWSEYERMATQGAAHFAADARRGEE